MRSLLVVLVLAPVLGGCTVAREFGRGFTSEAVKALPDLIGGAIEKKLGDDFADISNAVKGIEMPDIPEAPEPDPVGTGGIVAVAYMVGRWIARLGEGMVKAKLNNGPGPPA